jgi:hypothetical protein
MTAAVRFRVNSPNVIHETIDGESIIINLNTGNYYSLEKSAAAIWELLSQHLTLDEIHEALQARFEPGVDMSQAIATFLEQLKAEGLVVDAGPDARDASADGRSAIAPAGERQRFEAPVLQKYTDMQEFILLDPIREADEHGWPGADVPPSI